MFFEITSDVFSNNKSDQNISTSCKINNIVLDTCIYNACCPGVKTHKQLLKLTESHSSIILSKTCTLESKLGNPLPNYIKMNNYSINSIGCLNDGLNYYINNNLINKITKVKPYFISILINGINELNVIDNIIKNSNISGIEINLSCPNINKKLITGYDFELCKIIFKYIYELIIKNKNNITIGYKLPPYFDNSSFVIISELLLKYPPHFITCINTIPNCIEIDINNYNTIHGGMSGQIIKPIGLGNVYSFYKLLGDNIPIIGCGGISSGKDAYDYILCGASAIQIGTQFLKEGPLCFNRINNELTEIMKYKKYYVLNDFKGTLMKQKKNLIRSKL